MLLIFSLLEVALDAVLTLLKICTKSAFSKDCNKTTRDLATQEGIFAGVSSGGAVACAIKLSKKIKLNGLEKGVICEFKLNELKAPLSKKTIEYLKEQGIMMDAIIQFELKEVKIIDEKPETA